MRGGKTNEKKKKRRTDTKIAIFLTTARSIPQYQLFSGWCRVRVYVLLVGLETWNYRITKSNQIKIKSKLDSLW